MTDHKPLNKYQLNVIVKEYIDTGENIVLSLLCDYTESCWGFEDVKKTLQFFIKRLDKKIKENTIGDVIKNDSKI